MATYQTWSKLTKEESRRKSRLGRSSGVRGAGTLSYMAPEHLESINTPSTEKSDVYSFAIVVWVVLTGEEPYASKLGCHIYILSVNNLSVRHSFKAGIAWFNKGHMYELITQNKPRTDN